MADPLRPSLEQSVLNVWREIKEPSKETARILEGLGVRVGYKTCELCGERDHHGYVIPVLSDRQRMCGLLQEIVDIASWVGKSKRECIEEAVSQLQSLLLSKGNEGGNG
jgi:hypothetical protein